MNLAVAAPGCASLTKRQQAVFSETIPCGISRFGLLTHVGAVITGGAKRVGVVRGQASELLAFLSMINCAAPESGMAVNQEIIGRAPEAPEW